MNLVQPVPPQEEAEFPGSCASANERITGPDAGEKKKDCCKSWKKGKRCKKCPLRK